VDESAFAASHPVALARAAREGVGVGCDAPIADVLQLIERAAGIPVTLLPLPDKVAGAYGRAGQDEAYIFVNSATYAVRRRFTLAHEFGHHVLGHEGMVDLDEDLERGTSPRETQANQFATEFLAPLQAVSNWMEARGQATVTLEVLVQLANDFGISARSARYRLEDARYLTRKGEITRLDEDIRNQLHLQVVSQLGLELPCDTISCERIPIGSFRASIEIERDAVEAFRYQVLSLDEIAAALGRKKHEVEIAFKERGIEPLQDEPDY